MSEQLSLFDLPVHMQQPQDNSLTHEEFADIAWSYSRRSTLGQCVRRYYYEYYGANKRTAKREPEKEALHLLKQLQTRHERVGSILHLVIGTYLRKAQGGDVWQSERLVEWARSIFRTDVTYSRTHPDGDEIPPGNYPPALLQEFHYRVPNAADLCDEAEKKLTRALITFVSSELCQTFRVGGSQSTALIEHPFKLRNVLPCRVEGRIDLAYQNQGQTTILDWKLGIEDGIGDDSLQLAVYAMWALSQYSCEPESLRICKVHLGSATIVDFLPSQSLIAAARARILQDAEQMLMLEKYGHDAIVEAFTPCFQPAVCKLCTYKKICPEAKEIIHD